MIPKDLSIVSARPDQIAGVRALAETVWRSHYPGIIPPQQIDYMLARGYADDALAPFVEGADRGLELAVVDGTPVGFAAWYATDRIGEGYVMDDYVMEKRV